MSDCKDIYVDGVKYSPERQMKQRDNMKYCIIRTNNAGAWAGYLKKYDKMTCHADLIDARRLWYWAGACSLSEMAVNGTSKPEECKFPCEVEAVTLSGVLEIIPATDAAGASIGGVKIWTEHKQ